MEKLFSLEQIDAVAREILSDDKLCKIVLFQAGMGVGKTTLIKALVTALGVTDATSSPTFSIVNEYQSTQGDIIYHFDLYRIENEEEAYDMGLDEYFDSGNWCFVEWPENTPNIVPEQHSQIHLELQADGQRKITLKNRSN
ncbi:tRNA (adenosine(37)-N6)-threonylcarbamoyltransferase complex ATPase subunit type 1 TsaE [Flavobacterium sp. JP2137]|uniref:tRNA (adenosine(37)-N6)-threonylcarbamoyltransferase complex ATPase subunit type 1 TsaE n=1 Tax=Flavobacterium sp. JP2137 TaxID=3414510 RepID=UPI003D2FD806